MNPKQKKLLTRIIVALVLFVIIEVAAQTGVLAAAFGTPGDVYAEFALFLIPTSSPATTSSPAPCADSFTDTRWTRTSS